MSFPEVNFDSKGAEKFTKLFSADVFRVDSKWNREKIINQMIALSNWCVKNGYTMEYEAQPDEFDFTQDDGTICRIQNPSGSYFKVFFTKVK